VHGLDPFYKRLEEATGAPDADIELQELRDELTIIVKDVSAETTPPGERYLGIQKIRNMCNLYIGQQGMRGLERTKELVKICLSSAIPLLRYRPTPISREWEGYLLEVQAYLLCVEAHAGEVANAAGLIKASLAVQSESLQSLRKLATYFRYTLQGRI
jgi:hypothetical protein